MMRRCNLDLSGCHESALDTVFGALRPSFPRWAWLWLGGPFVSMERCVEDVKRKLSR